MWGAGIEAVAPKVSPQDVRWERVAAEDIPTSHAAVLARLRGVNNAEALPLDCVVFYGGDRKALVAACLDLGVALVDAGNAD